ncbi:hypothetical protein KSF_084190 [Reticulibacter mediterranei]|uniref:Uncharacterized protein n=1 Tax=Reticulibacter mediterranei TaxID=2778369 RepID=A0A8J3IYG4_9CHLR|nr:hypothetical protein KSF_084190 [Reticulibacter mediterranei]
MVVCKFYDKEGTSEWYVIEAEKKDNTYVFYGYVMDDTKRLGEYTLKELEARKTVQRSIFFKPCPLSFIKVFE